MKRMLFLFLVIGAATMTCSCSDEVVNSSESAAISSESIATEASRVTEEAISISDLSPEVTNAEYIPAIDTIPTIQVEECEFDISDNHITAHYDDGFNTIDYDMDYYDYGVDTVSIFSVEKSNRHVPSYRNDALQDGWCYTLIDPPYLRYTREEDMVWDSSVYNAIVDSVSSIRVENISNIEEIDSVFSMVSEDINLSPFVQIYDYRGCETVSLNNMIGLMHVGANGNFMDSLSSTVGDSLRHYIVREELEGLPVNVVEGAYYCQNKVHYNDYFGSIWMTSDRFYTDFYNAELGAAVDIVYSNCINYDEVESGLSVIPLEDCIANSISPIIHNAYSPQGSHAYAYNAELIYIPFEEGLLEPGTDWDYDIYMVPVWAIYIIAGTEEVPDWDTGSVVYINAITGENVTRNMTVD